MKNFEDDLGDAIFVDYFNTFLSLPIFSTRFLYRPRRKVFEVDCSIRSQQIDNKVLSAWISSERLPLFLQTDLFLDYSLCKLLIAKAEQDERKQVTSLVDESTFRKYIGHLIGMQNFRFYTKGTIGECILNFWSDAEKFRRHSTPERRRFAFRDIQYKYLKNGSAFEVPDTIKWSICGSGGRGNLNETAKKGSLFSEDIFVPAQELVLDSLYSYWVPKYILHKCREYATTYEQRRMSRAIVAKHLKGFAPKVNARKVARRTSEYQKQDERRSSEPIVEDQELEKEKNAFFETNRVSSSESDYREAHGRKSRAGSSFLPEIIRSETTCTASPDPLRDEERSRSGSLKLPTLTSNTNSTVWESSEDEEKVLKSSPISCRKNTRHFDIKDLLKLGRPFAMLENEEPQRRSRKNRNKSITEEPAPETVIQAVSKVSPTNIVQFIKPSYHEEIPRKPLSAYHSGPDNYAENRSDARNVFLASITADRLAGGPFKEYLKNNRDTTSLNNLKFWEDVQIYIGMSHSSTVDMKFKYGRNLLVTYLQPQSIREMNLEPSVQNRVCQLVQKGQADALLSKIADQILELIHQPWRNFMEADREHLRAIQERNSEAGPSDGPSQNLEDSDETFRMYRALDLALCLGQGDFQMLAVEEEVSENEEDGDEHDGSLRKRRLTIVNEEAAVALAMSPDEAVGQNIRRNSHFYGKISRKPRKSSLLNSAALKIRPPKPKKFQDVLSDPVQLLWLKRFLVEHDAITPLKFWQDVEKMKTQSRDSRARQTKVRVIVKSYFANTEDPSINLHCRAEIIKEIPRIEHVTPAMLVSAQACVIRSLEEQWFGRYLATFPEDLPEEDVAKFTPRNTFLGVTRMAARGKTRGLWALFGQTMTSFIRGVKNPKTFAEFVQFLTNESVSCTDGRKNVQSQRRMVNNRVISADRLVNDVRFWLEVQRYKCICDDASASAMAGNYTVDDEALIQNKARTVIDCYIDSILPPKIQVNIPAEIADGIDRLWTSGILDRSLFYDAEIYVFCTLIHYWKKYLARETNQMPKTKVPEKKTKKKPRGEIKKTQKEILYLGDMPYRLVDAAPDDDSYPKLSYALSTGLRLILSNRADDE